MLPEYLIIFPVLVYHIMNLYDTKQMRVPPQKRGKAYRILYKTGGGQPFEYFRA